MNAIILTDFSLRLRRRYAYAYDWFCLTFIERHGVFSFSNLVLADFMFVFICFMTQQIQFVVLNSCLTSSTLVFSYALLFCCWLFSLYLYWMTFIGCFAGFRSPYCRNKCFLCDILIGNFLKGVNVGLYKSQHTLDVIIGDFQLYILVQHTWLFGDGNGMNSSMSRA